MLAVPRIFEKIYNGARTKAHSESPIKGRIFDQAERVAISYSEALQAGKVPPLLKAQHVVFDKLVYSKIRELLGGKRHLRGQRRRPARRPARTLLPRRRHHRAARATG